MNQIERELGEIKNDLATHNHELLNDLSDVYIRIGNVKCFDVEGAKEVVEIRNAMRDIMDKIQG